MSQKILYTMRSKSPSHSGEIFAEMARMREREAQKKAKIEARKARHNAKEYKKAVRTAQKKAKQEARKAAKHASAQRRRQILDSWLEPIRNVKREVEARKAQREFEQKEKIRHENALASMATTLASGRGRKPGTITPVAKASGPEPVKSETAERSGDPARLSQMLHTLDENPLWEQATGLTFEGRGQDVLDKARQALRTHRQSPVLSAGQSLTGLSSGKVTQLHGMQDETALSRASEELRKVMESSHTDICRIEGGIAKRKFSKALEHMGYSVSKRKNGAVRATKGEQCIWAHSDDQGMLTLDASGFPGLTCQGELNRVREELARQGLELEIVVQTFHPRDNGGVLEEFQAVDGNFMDQDRAQSLPERN